MIRSLLLAGALGGLALTTSACPGGNQLAGISDSTFVDVMSQLHRIETDQRWSREDRDSLRAGVLRSEGLSPEQLESAAQSLADQPERAIALWRAIEQRALQPPRAAPQEDAPRAPPRDPRAPDHAH